MEFRLLGPVQVWSGGRSVPVGGTRERRALAALLLDANRTVSVDRLVQVLWGGDPPPTAAAQIRNTMAALRRNFAEAGAVPFERSGDGFVIHATPDELDVLAFDRAVIEARRQQDQGHLAEAATTLRTALGLYRGSPLDGIGDVLETERAALEERRLTTVERRVELDLALGRHHDLLGELAQLVPEQPTKEHLAELYLLALYRAGRRQDALDEFVRIRDRLAEELGLDPRPQLAALQQAMLRGDLELEVEPPAGEPTITPVPVEELAWSRNDLPRDVADFTGRAAELDRLLALLPGRPGGGEEATTVIISAIDGMAGIGKTTLAVHAAHRLVEGLPVSARSEERAPQSRTKGLPDAALFVDLRAHTAGQEPVDPALALDRMLRAVGVAADRIPDGLDERSALWRAELATRRVVVVLDNAASASQVRPLLPGAPGSLTLITSRQRLSDLEATRQISLDVLSESEGAVLFGRVVGDGRPDAEPEQVAAVVRLCGHLPLAIRIAAARLRNRPAWTVAHLAERLADGQHRLAELAVGDSRLAAAFAVSYQRLDLDQQRLFRLLGLIPVPDFDAYLAAALSGAEPALAGRILEELVDANLLQSSAPGRYRFHDLLREYAVALAESEPEAVRRTATGSALDYYLSATAAAMAPLERVGDLLPIDLTGPAPAAAPVADAGAARSWLEAEHVNLVTVIGIAAARTWHTHAWQLAYLLQYHFNLGAHTNDWLSTHEIAVASARSLGDRRAEAHMLCKLGMGYHTQARFRDAIDHYDQAMKLYRETGDRDGEATTLNHLGNTYLRLDRYDEALRHYEPALAIWRATGHRGGEGASLQNIGMVFAYLGRNPEALDHFQRAVAIARQIGDRRSEAITLSNIGVFEESLGDYDAARRDLKEALKLNEAMGNQPAIAAVLTSLGNVDLRQSRYAESIDQHLRALDVACSADNRLLECEVLNNLGETYGASGATTNALDVYEQALLLATQLGVRRERARAHHGIADALAAGDPATAREHARAALAIYEDLQVPDAKPVRKLLSELDARG